MPDAPEKSLYKPAQLHDQETRAVISFLGEPQIIPEPPRELLTFVERTNKLGFTFEPYFEPKHDFKDGEDLPGWKVKPYSSFFNLIQKGEISPSVASLDGKWAAMEGIRRPNFEDAVWDESLRRGLGDFAKESGQQLHADDALGDIIRKLRSAGEIPTPKDPEIPETSRFVISRDRSYMDLILDQFAQLAQVERAQVGIPSYMSWNYRGNVAHPEWGEADTFEIFDDSSSSGLGFPLVGGSSKHGGLGFAEKPWQGIDYLHVAFRMRVAFLSAK